MPWRFAGQRAQFGRLDVHERCGARGEPANEAPLLVGDGRRRPERLEMARPDRRHDPDRGLEKSREKRDVARPIGSEFEHADLRVNGIPSSAKGSPISVL
jgi:hypothetical protein